MSIITISRGTFSGGQDIALCAAKRLGYRCISREILVESAKQYGISEEKLFKAITEVPGIMEHLHSTRKKYLACLRATLISLAKDDNIVYHGHAGHLLLRGIPDTLKVRVIANMEFRIQSLISRQSLSREEAIKYIKKVDEERIKWTRFLYHVDWYDPRLYDMVINLDHMTLGGACDVLYRTASLEERQATAESPNLMEDLVLSSHLEAMIANVGNISGSENIEIEAHGGVVTIRGTVGTLVDTDRIRKIVWTTPGVKDIISQMRVQLPGLTTAIIDKN